MIARCGKRMHRKHARGMTLMDSVFALLVFGIGVVAVFGMLSRVSTANRRTAYMSSALDAYAQISAQVRDAKCFYPAETPGNIAAAIMDPGLDVIGAGWIDTADPRSNISRVGDILNTVPNLHVSYRVTSDVVTVNAAPSLNIDVKVREIMHDAAMDDPALDNGYWIQIFPVKKMCNPRIDATSRGEYY